MAFSMIKPVMAIALGLGGACGPETNLDDDDGSSSSTAVEPETDDVGQSSTTSDSTGTSGTDGSGSSSNSTDPTVASADGTTSTLVCELPALEQEVLDQLYIAGGAGGFVAAGTQLPLRLQWIDFGTPTVVDACVEWSIEPVRGVQIDASGLLSVEASVAAGTTISVSADVEEGRRILTTDFEVYEPLEYEILGFWSEVQQLPCGGGAPFEPDPIIGELVLQDTGEFSVTWTPFEVYYDYWGTFTYDEGTDALVLSVDGGNYIPEDLDGEGTARVMDGQLVLEDMWLGVAQTPVTPVACGHVFE